MRQSGILGSFRRYSCNDFRGNGFVIVLTPGLLDKP